MRPLPILLLCGLLASALPASDAWTAEGDSLYRQLQQKGAAPTGPKQRTGAPTTKFVENMRAKGIEPIPDTTRRATTSAPAVGPHAAGLATGQGRSAADVHGPAPAPKTGAAVSPKTQPAAKINTPQIDAPGKFNGRVAADGRGGYRTFDASGTHTKSLTPDGRGGYRVYDAVGRYQGRVNVK
jgi:hypothetical protein